MCTLCGKDQQRDDLLVLDGQFVCTNCKPVYLQHLHEGVADKAHEARPSFLFTATNSEGKAVTEYVEAASLGAAAYALELRGYTNVTFHQDDLMVATQKTFRDPSSVRSRISAKQMLEAQRPCGPFGLFLQFLKANFWILIFFAFWLGPELMRERYTSFRAISAYVAIGVFGLISLWLVLPLRLYMQLMAAVEWGRDEEIRSTMKTIRRVNPLLVKGLPELELDVREAQVLAKHGRLDEALGLIQKHENSPKIEKWVYQARLQSVYAAAHDYDRAITLAQLGRREEALKLFGEVEEWLHAADERLLIERCMAELGVARTSKVG